MWCKARTPGREGRGRLCRLARSCKGCTRLRWGGTSCCSTPGVWGLQPAACLVPFRACTFPHPFPVRCRLAPPPAAVPAPGGGLQLYPGVEGRQGPAGRAHPWHVSVVWAGGAAPGGVHPATAVVPALPNWIPMFGHAACSLHPSAHRQREHPPLWPAPSAPMTDWAASHPSLQHAPGPHHPGEDGPPAAVAESDARLFGQLVPRPPHRL